MGDVGKGASTCVKISKPFVTSYRFLAVDASTRWRDDALGQRELHVQMEEEEEEKKKHR